MIYRVFSIICRRLLFLVMLALVLLAVYVLVGRQLPSLVPDWTGEVEARLSEMAGMEVRIDALEARWEGFSPVFMARGVTLFNGSANGAEAAMSLDQLQLAIDVPASVISLRLMLSQARVRDLQLEFSEHTDGSWTLDGMANNERGIDAATVFDIATRFRDVNILNGRFGFNFSDGERQELRDVAALFRSRADAHHLQFDARINDKPEFVQLSAELQGRDFAALSGMTHLQLPASDYSALSAVLSAGDMRIPTLTGAAELWLQLSNGTVSSADVSLELDSIDAFNTRTEQTLSIHDLASTINLRRDDDAWRLWLQDLGFRRDASVWARGDAFLEYGDDGGFRVLAEHIDLGTVGALLATTRMLPEQGLAELRTVNPRGQLANIALSGSVIDSQLQTLSLQSNLEDVRVSPRGATPSIWGVHGYSELNYAADQQLLSGFVEVDSTQLMMHLPQLFDQIWAYDHVNGRVNFRVDTLDGMQLRVDSSVITAQSELVTGRAQFATEYDIPVEGERRVSLELMVGALEADISGKSAYLPMAPGALPAAQGVLGWVDQAVLSGKGGGSGFLFRGAVHGGAQPAERTMQMFYRVSDGTLRFDPEWPVLESVDSLVVVDDTEVEVTASAGNSLGIGFSSTRAAVRSNPTGPGRWLTVSGEGRGEARQGMEYLRETPVTAGLGNYFSGWETDGDVDFTLELAIPLFIEGEEPEINLMLGMNGNTIHIPEFALDIDNVNGTLKYNGREGLGSEALTADFFGQSVEVDVRNVRQQEGLTDTQVSVEGEMRVADLMAWPLSPDWVGNLENAVDGRFSYVARLDLPQQQPGRQTRPSLRVSSDLEGVTVALPAPLDKEPGQAMPLDLTMHFDDGSHELQLRLADLASINARLHDDQRLNGLVFLGPPPEGVTVRRLNQSAPGLEVLGSLPDVDLADWQDSLGQIFPERLAASGSQSIQYSLSRLRGLIAALDVNVNSLAYLGEQFSTLNVQLREQDEAWRFSLQSPQLAGQVRVPFSEDEILEVDLLRLHLGDASQAGVVDEGEEIRFEELDTVEYVLPREDPLQAIDPRSFPAMSLRIAELFLDGADYGDWSLRLNPVESGALFTNLRVEARGLALGTEEEPARFLWRYNGDVHHSELRGPVEAVNLADVLSAYGYAPSLESSRARFDVDLNWQGSPGFFAAVGLRGDIDILIENGRFMQATGPANSALKLISIINFDALVRRLRFSDDLIRQGLAYDEIRGRVALNQGVVSIQDRLQIIGPSSLFQVAGDIDLGEERIDGSLYVTLPVSENIPWVSGLAALNNLINWQVAIGVFVLDRIFGDQVDNLTSAQYALEGSWENVEPRLNQVFGTGDRR